MEKHKHRESRTHRNNRIEHSTRHTPLLEPAHPTLSPPRGHVPDFGLGSPETVPCSPHVAIDDATAKSPAAPWQTTDCFPGKQPVLVPNRLHDLRSTYDQGRRQVMKAWIRTGHSECVHNQTGKKPHSESVHYQEQRKQKEEKDMVYRPWSCTFSALDDARSLALLFSSKSNSC